MKAFLVLVCLALSFVGMQAQDHPCASDQRHNQLLESDPVYQRSFFNLERRIHAMRHEVQSRMSVVHTIPVVVHVMHEGEPIGTGSNITDEQVLSAIEALNEDFRKMAGSNGDGNGVDVELEFCLAVRDPQGNGTTGINRIDASVVTDYAEMGIEATSSTGADESEVKALSTWPNTDYLNIWVVNEIEDNDASGGVQGYAYFPTSNVNDGIVILHNAFGTVGNLKPNTDMNRTLTHEVGHSFALYHTFHDSDDCSETNCETQGDRVCDTPTSVLQISCSSPACSGTQQVENYMDYTTETCRNMFTQGQKERMWAALLEERLSLTTSMGCIPVADLDAGVNSVESPVGGQCSGSISPQVTIANYGANTLTAVTIEYGAGSYTESYQWTGTLAQGHTASVALPAFNAADGSYNFQARTANPNGAQDEMPANDNETSAFTVGGGAQLTLTVVTDYFGSETTWEMFDDAGEVVASGGPYANNQQGTANVENLCFPEGCYSLHMYDQFGDGQSFTAGSYELTDGSGNLIAGGAGDWGEEAIHAFCAEGDPDVDPTDPPVADFNVQAGALCVGSGVDFTNTSTGEVLISNWTFENGIPSTSALTHPNAISWNQPGTYAVTLEVTGAGGTTSHTQTITIDPLPVVSVESTPVSCHGAADGEATVSFVGNGNYTISWSTGASAQTIDGLDGGSYTVTVTDGTCSGGATAFITEPEAISLQLLAENEDCSGTPGTANVSPEGGVPPLDVNWSNGATSDTAGDLGAGDYSVSVTDANGCTTTEAFTIAPAGALEISLDTSPISCHGLTDGEAAVTATGGTGAYSYNWSNGETGTVVSGLPPGEISVTVLDDSGCSATINGTIESPAALTIAATGTDLLCHGDGSGAFSASTAGGVGNHAIQWSNGATGTGQSEVDAGTYTATVTDNNGCMATTTVTVGEPPALSASIFKQDITCFGANDGSVQASAQGGTGEITLSWNTGESGSMLTGLNAASYTVTATDSNGCIVTESIAVQEPDPVEPNLTALDIACGNTHGSAYVDPSGGVGFYTVDWSHGESGLETIDLDAGTYNVTVADENGCSTALTFSISESESLVLEADAQDVSCTGLTDGVGTVSVNGGDGSYSYNWSSGAGGPTSSNLAPGEYTVEVTDASGCSGAATVTIGSPAPLEITLFKTDISCHGMEDGSASASVTGGTGLKTFSWSNGQSGQSIHDLEAGNVEVLVTDDNACQAQESATIVEPSNITSTTEILSAETCAGNDGAALVNAMGGTGDLDFLWSSGQTIQMVEGLSAGEYTVLVSDMNDCFQAASLTIPWDCDAINEVTQLDENSCGLVDLLLDETINCVPVPNAEMYQWRFENAAAGFLSEVFTAGNNPSCWLGDVTGLHYGLFVTVKVRVMVNGIWGNYAEACYISTQNFIPPTGLVQSDCGTNDLTIGDWLHCEGVPGAEVYNWRFSHDTHIISAETYAPEIPITEQLGLETLANYTVEVRTQVGPMWSDWGLACPISTANAVGIALTDGGMPRLMIYPNPTDGQSIAVHWDNLPNGTHVVPCSIYEATGALVEVFSIPATETTTWHAFQNRLTPGVYLLQYTLDTRLIEERLLVR